MKSSNQGNIADDDDDNDDDEDDDDYEIDAV